MKRYPTILIIGLLAFSACQHTAKTSSADSTARSATHETPEGYYEAGIASASSPGRLIGLQLKGMNDAIMTTDYMNQTPEIVQIGNWSTLDSNQLLITLVRVGGGNPAKDTLIFARDGNSLRYTGSAYGTDGLSLVKKEKQEPAAKELIIWVKSEEQCDRGPGFGTTKCYQVQYGDKLTIPAKETWDKLFEPIDGFTYEKGRLYKLKVNRIPREKGIQDVGAYTYKLETMISKEPLP